MANIRRYTSPTQELIVEGVDITAADVYVVYRQGTTLLRFSGDEIDMEAVTQDEQTNTVISVYMPQETTALFRQDKEAEVQVNWIEDGQRNATTIARVDILRNLLEEVIGDD